MTWVDPLPPNSVVQSGFNHSTLVITDAVASNTGYYTCLYEDQPEKDTDIYVFVLGTLLLFKTTKYISKIISTFCICKMVSHLFFHRS